MSKLKNAYAVIIGVGADLKESVTDATALYNILVDENLCGYDEDKVYLLTENKATKDNIINTLTELKEITDQNSSILLFYSGHGGYHEGADIYYLQPNDFTPTNFIDAKDLKQIINEIKSKRLVLFLDCCHAAGMFKEGIGKHQTDLIKEDTSDHKSDLSQVEGLAQKIDNDQGISIVSSCREDQLSWIMDGDHNSLFTKCLLEVLRASHRTYFEDEFVRISEVVNYIFKKVPEIQPSQNPYVNLQIYDDFALSYIPQSLQANIDHTLNSNSQSSSNSPKNLITSFREEDGNTNLLLFVHGFTGESSDTFGEIPQFLLDETSLNGWDMKPLGFSSQVTPELGKNVWGSTTDIRRIVDYLVTSFQYKFEKYKRIAIIAHSLGGLVAQKAIIELPSKDLNRISHLILFATPSLGIDQDLLDGIWQGKYSEMKPKGDFITSLRDRWKHKFGIKYPFRFKTVAGVDDSNISISSCHAPFDQDYSAVVNGDHFSIVQPNSTDNDSYRLIINTLQDNEFFNHFTDKSDINIILGEYAEVVSNLLPNVESLDMNGLRQLIFGLEGLDRGEEALDILENHELAKNNSDLLGIIGGRYKRDYLKTYNTKSGELAYMYYEKGIQMAEDNKDTSQIYYHAINLAFLSLILKSNEQEMRLYANMALESCKKSRKNLWQIATEAECYLYMDDLILSRARYEEAALLSDVRQKLSMYTNAYSAYTKLMDTTNENDDFIRFLNATLLK